MKKKDSPILLSYETDPHNNLVIKKSGKKTDLPRFRKVLKGHFKVDENNNLDFLVRTPVSKHENIPHQVRLKGNWSLDDNHNLVFTLNKWKRQTFGDKLTLKGKIEKASKDSLDFSVTTYNKENSPSKYVLKLGGVWAVNEDNRLTFKVRKEKGPHDILTFKNAWQINKHNRITYRYEKACLITKKKQTEELVFKGYWDIESRSRISYVLEGASGSKLSFKADYASFKKNFIRYRVGIGIKEKTKLKTQEITLFGKWRLKKGLGLLFDVEYEKGRVHSVGFGAYACLTDEDTVSFKLKDKKNKDLEAEVKLGREFLEGSGEGFIKFLKEKSKSSVLIGAGFRW
jgi:hypothetical protein